MEPALLWITHISDTEDIPTMLPLPIQEGKKIGVLP
jgi:hypothetical protein